MEKWSRRRSKYVFNSETGEFYFGNAIGLAALALSIAGAYVSDSGKNPLILAGLGVVCGIAGIIFGYRSLADALKSRSVFKGAGAAFGILCSLLAIIFSVIIAAKVFLPQAL